MVRYNDLTNSSVNYGRDVRQRVINVDADFRESSVYAYDGSGYLLTQNTPTDFLFKLSTPVRNVGGFKITSFEASDLSYATMTGNYALLQVNDENSIESRAAGGRELRGVAKIPKLISGTSILLSDSTGMVSNNVVFRNPQDVSVLRVRLVNPDGTVVKNSTTGSTYSQTPTSKVSFTLELDEVTNAYLYESQRKHIGYDPANVSK